jgi:hypothetical protein
MRSLTAYKRFGLLVRQSSVNLGQQQATTGCLRHGHACPTQAITVVPQRRTTTVEV